MCSRGRREALVFLAAQGLGYALGARGLVRLRSARLLVVSVTARPFSAAFALSIDTDVAELHDRRIDDTAEKLLIAVNSVHSIGVIKASTLWDAAELFWAARPPRTADQLCKHENLERNASVSVCRQCKREFRNDGP